MTEDFTRPAGNPEALGQDAGVPGRPPVGPPPPVTPPAPVTPPPPGAPAPVSTGPAHVAQGSDDGGAKEAAKEEASKLAGSAKEQAANVAGTAKDEVKQAAGEAKRHAQQLYRQGTSEISSQAGTQQQRLASGLRSFSSEMNQMADGTEEPGVATDVARWASQAADDAGRWLENREPGELLEEVGRYARRNPGTFMLIAAGLGLAAGRVARSLKDMGDDDADTSGGTSAGVYASGQHGTTGTTTTPVGYSTGTSPLSGTATPPPPMHTYGTGTSTHIQGDQPGGLR
ncbi:hypothetical protein M3148_05385 [Georgenia satyanarayanai]|uniref:hypothetical protein n=1 Tax=Georgenia satyanarayanai TaxID=860221 RepID=UPI00203D46AC|nr:hypothetical protein [Georgenia satyanarayanai]MCM3660429.1 hypothetical protein [Georgenia satyanarayanai]